MSDQREVRFTGGSALQAREPRSWKPFAIAGAAIALVVLALVLVGRSKPVAADPRALAAYRASLPISQVQMSNAGTMLSSGQQTYLDGVIANHGSQTVTAIMVQATFKNFSGGTALRETLPLNFIRITQPYIDTEPISAEPLKPGDQHTFRLIFDSVPADWDQQYPAVQIVSVTTK